MPETPKLNFLAPVAATHSRWRRRRIARLLIVAFVLMAASLFAATAAAPGESFSPLLEQISPRGIIQNVGRLFLSQDRRLKGEADDRINILLTGIGGEGHDGPQLTDTVILVSYKPSERRAALISIPRDLLVEMPGAGWRKLNAVNAYAESAEPGSGGRVTAEVLSQTLGLPIGYWLRIDFAGFRRFIDELGGILVYVDRAFTDSEYPAGENLYQTVSFSAGWQRMDGERALTFVRSRHGGNFEGSDFARSRRQQKVLTAIKEELLSAETLANPAKVMKLYGIVAGHLTTSLESWEIMRAISLGREADTTKTVYRTLEADGAGPLVAGSYAGAYVLVPASGSFEELKQMVRTIFDSAPKSAGESAPISRAVRVEIQNGTGVTGFAARAAESLRAQGYIISYIGNAQSRGYDRTVIYDLSGGKFSAQLSELRRILDGDVSVTIPEWFSSSPLPPTITVVPPAPQGGAGTADLLIILGKSSASLLSSR